MLAAVRPTLVGCALVAALLLPGCGGGGSDSTSAPTVTSRAATTEPKSQNSAGKKKVQPAKEHASAGGPCQDQLGSFVASMDSLRRRLAVGLTYDQYVAEVRGIRSTYRKIPI
ncbi:MAG TPA: hypothetical protein VFP21_06150, partial [Solirubrobacterales bacterium]|nr:hypothetical protein [Solirubrobacterales bacterium]